MDTLKVIFDSITELNMDLEPDAQIPLSSDTQLFGSGESLDSLQLINLITIIEQKIEEETGDYYSLADENAMSLDESPFKTVATLKNYVDKLLSQQ